MVVLAWCGHGWAEGLWTVQWRRLVVVWSSSVQGKRLSVRNAEQLFGASSSLVHGNVDGAPQRAAASGQSSNHGHHSRAINGFPFGRHPWECRPATVPTSCIFVQTLADPTYLVNSHGDSTSGPQSLPSDAVKVSLILSELGGPGSPTTKEIVPNAANTLQAPALGWKAGQ